MMYRKILVGIVLLLLLASVMAGTIVYPIEEDDGSEELKSSGDDEYKEIRSAGGGEGVRSLADTPWPKFRGDKRNTGLSPYDTSHVDGTEKWNFSTSGSDPSPTIGGNGTVFVGSGDTNLYAVNQDGTEKWNFSTSGSVPSYPTIGGDGTIYVGSRDDNLYAVNPDGTEKWTFETGDEILSSPSIGDDGTIYVGSYDNNLYAIDPDGTEKWSFSTSDWVVSSPAIGSDGTIYVGSYDYNLYAVNPDGTEKWSFSTGDYLLSSPAIGSDGTIYVGSCDDNLYAVNPDGTEKWTFETGGEIISSPAIGDYGTIYVGSYDNNLYAIDPDGSEKWNFTTGDRVHSSPAIGSDGTIYVGSWDDNLYAVNPDGTEKWSFSTGDDLWSSPAIGSDGTVYVGSLDGNLYAITGGYEIPLTTGGPSDGWNFVSTAYTPYNKDLESILNDTDYGISGSYEKVMYYDADTEEWKSYMPDRDEHFNNLDTWDHTMGVWINMATDDTLTIPGKPPSNTDITLESGWNMVGYPSETSGNQGLPEEVTKIGYFNASEEYNLAYDYDPESFIFDPGQGYWVYNGANEPVTWTVEYEYVPPPPTMISTWNTENAGVSNDDQIQLPLEEEGNYDFTVEWGDGTSDTITEWDQLEVTHTYDEPGIYNVSITGTIDGWTFNDGGDAEKIIKVSQWGPLALGDSGGYFYGCSNMELTATDAPDLTGTTTLAYAFRGCEDLGSSGNMSSWDV